MTLHYSIEITATAEKELSNLDRGVHRRVANKILLRGIEYGSEIGGFFTWSMIPPRLWLSTLCGTGEKLIVRAESRLLAKNNGKQRA